MCFFFTDFYRTPLYSTDESAIVDSFKKRTVNKFKSALHYLTLHIAYLRNILFLDMMINKDAIEAISDSLLENGKGKGSLNF